VKEITKDIPVQVRMDEQDVQRLDLLAYQSVRTRSDMIRFLVRQEYERKVREEVNHDPAASDSAENEVIQVSACGNSS